MALDAAPHFSVVTFQHLSSAAGGACVCQAYNPQTKTWTCHKPCVSGGNSTGGGLGNVIGGLTGGAGGALGGLAGGAGGLLSGIGGSIAGGICTQFKVIICVS